MAGFLGEDQIRRVKEAIDLVDVMADYTTPKQSGVNFKACCPFHHERTPSLYVYTADQQYHCFGCGVHGDIITLIQEKEGLDFMGAVEWLARRAGIQLEYKQGSQQGTGNRVKQNDKQRYIDVMESVCAYYERQLWSNSHAAEARAYLEQRGLSEALAKTFRLGWAPGRDSMTSVLLQDGVAFDDLETLDVSVDGERGKADRFRQRLMFPICDRFGQVIGFSGRLLPQQEKDFKERGIGVGKYINSRDTPLYHKSDVVFNLHIARPAARETKRVIVMEGPTDVMAAHQHGITECVAVLGTALTANHAKQISQSVGQDGRILLLFDGDDAGQKNSVKAVKTCMQAGVPSQAAVMSSGQDPAELLSSGDNTEFETILRKRLNDIDHLLRQIAPRPFELDSRQQLSVIDEILEVLRELKDKALCEAFLEDIAHYLNIDVQRLHRRLKDGQRPQRPTYEDEDDEYAEFDLAAALPVLSVEQEHILGLLCAHPDLRTVAFDKHSCEPNDFPEPWRQLVLSLSLQHDLDREGVLTLPSVVSHPPFRQAILSLMHHYGETNDGAGVLEEVMVKMQCRRYETGIKQLEFELADAQRIGNNEAYRSLGKELFEMTLQLRRLRGQDA